MPGAGASRLGLEAMQRVLHFIRLGLTTHSRWCVVVGSSSIVSRRTGLAAPRGRRSVPVSEQISREQLPIPDRPYEGSCPSTPRTRRRRSRRSSRCGRRRGRPNVLVVLLDDVGFGASSAFGGPCATPTAERLAAGGLKYNRFHTTALCSPTRAGAATGRNHHTVGHGRDHRDRDLGARLQLDPPEHLRAAGRDAEAERLLDRAVRQVPRGAGVGDEPDGPVRRLADRRRRLRVLLRLHRRRDEPVLPGASTRARRRSSPTRRPRRATTSPRT